MKRLIVKRLKRSTRDDDEGEEWGVLAMVNVELKAWCEQHNRCQSQHGSHAAAAHICQRCSLMCDLMHCENTAKIQKSTWLRITWRSYNKAIEKPIIISREQDTEGYIVSRHSHRSGYNLTSRTWETNGKHAFIQNISGGILNTPKQPELVLHNMPRSEAITVVDH